MNIRITERSERRRWSVAVPVLQFAVAGVVMLIVVGIATSMASARVGEQQAIADARSQTLVRARDVVEPEVVDALVTVDANAVAIVDEVVRQAVLDDSLVRVKIWRRDGTIVYSDEARLVGTQYLLGEEELSALAGDEVEAEVSDLGKPENRFERDFGKLLEVYLPIHAPDGTPLLFEAYFRYEAVSSSGAHVWRSFAPITIGSLLVLELVQIPLAWRLARRLQQRRREREALLQRAVDASDLERRRIAADLHDGVVQDLAGVALTLASAARSADVDASSAALLDAAAADVRDSIKTLRSLLVEIYPPNLFEDGLEAALDDLLARARGRDVTTALDVRGIRQPLAPPVAGVLYRVAQESLRNALAHSGATEVRVSVSTKEDMAMMDVVDDGGGFDPSAVRRNPEHGHFGLRGLGDLVTDAGGTLLVESSRGQGTRIHVEVSL